MTALYGDGRASCATPGCDHLDVQHNLATDRRTRTACTHSEGPQGTPCGCRRFTPKETP